MNKTQEVWPAEFAALSAAGPAAFNGRVQARLNEFMATDPLAGCDLVVQYHVTHGSFLQTSVYQQFFGTWVYLDAGEGAEDNVIYETANLATLMMRDKQTNMAALTFSQATPLTLEDAAALPERSILAVSNEHGDIAPVQRFGYEWYDIYQGMDDGGGVSTGDLFAATSRIELLWAAPNPASVPVVEPVVVPASPIAQAKPPVDPEILAQALAVTWTGAPYPSKQSLARARRSVKMLTERGFLR